MIDSGIQELDKLFENIKNHGKIYNLFKSVSGKESKMIIDFI